MIKLQQNNRLAILLRGVLIGAMCCLSNVALAAALPESEWPSAELGPSHVRQDVGAGQHEDKSLTKCTYIEGARQEPYVRMVPTHWQAREQQGSSSDRPELPPSDLPSPPDSEHEPPTSAPGPGLPPSAHSKSERPGFPPPPIPEPAAPHLAPSPPPMPQPAEPPPLSQRPDLNPANPGAPAQQPTPPSPQSEPTEPEPTTYRNP